MRKITGKTAAFAKAPLSPRLRRSTRSDLSAIITRLEEALAVSIAACIEHAPNLIKQVEVRRVDTRRMEVGRVDVDSLVPHDWRHQIIVGLPFGGVFPLHR